MRPSLKGGVLAIALFGLLTSGCSETNQPSDVKSNSDEGQTLTIYTGRDKDEVAVVDLFTRQHPDVEYAGPVRTVRVVTAVGELQAEIPSSSGRVMRGQVIHLSVVESALHIVGSRGES